MNVQFHYELLLLDPDGKTHSDITSCTFFRIPLSKQASFCMIRVNISQLLIEKWQDLISKNDFPKFKLKIYTNNDTTYDKGTTNHSKLSLVAEKALICLDIITDQTLSFRGNKGHVNMIMVNPVLYHMQVTNTFNQILFNKTGKDIINAFEGFISSTHQSIFKFNPIGINLPETLNNHQYEQILCKSKNDVNFPTYIINTYKPLHSFNFYFFDDFYITDEGNNKPITNHWFNMYDINQYKKVDIQKYSDKFAFFKKIKRIPLFDKSRQLDKNDTSVIFQNINHISKTDKPTKTNIVKGMETKVDKIDLVKNRDVKLVENDGYIKEELGQTSQFSTCYVPDDPGNGSSRLSINNELLKTKIDCLYLYEITDGVIDFPQFGFRYNYDTTKLSDYTFTPLNICNIFVRKNYKEHYMKLINRFTLIKFFEQK